MISPDMNTIKKLTEEEENVGNTHFTVNIQKALKESIDQNDNVTILLILKLRLQISDLLKQNEELRKELDEKDEAILELGEHYQVTMK